MELRQSKFTRAARAFAANWMQLPGDRADRPWALRVLGT